MRAESQPAFVLHTRDFRDSSLLVDMLTADYGRISLVAKGVRGRGKQARHKRSSLQPFNALSIAFAGKGEVKTLFAHEALAVAYPLKGSALYSAFYMNELLVRLLQPYGGQAEIFTLYQWALQALARGEDIEICLRRFELKLLEYLGYGLNLHTDVLSGEGIVAGRHYRFVVDSGFTGLDDRQLPLPAAEAAYSGADILAIAEDRLDAASKRVAKQLCRQLLKTHLGDKPLKSRELFLSLGQQSDALAVADVCERHDQ